MSWLGSCAFDTFGVVGNITDYAQSLASGCSLVSAAGRCGSVALYNINSLGGGPTFGVTTTEEGGYFGFAYAPDAFHVTSTVDITAATGQILGFIIVQSDGSIAFWKGPNTILGTLIGTTAAGLISLGHYSYIGVEFKFNAATGYVRIYVDQPSAADGGVAAYNSGAVNTTNGSTSGQWRALVFNPKGYTCDYDFGDTAGAAPHNAYRGDNRVEGQLPLTDAVGGPATDRDWTPSTGTDHGALLDEVPPNDATDYLESGTVGNKETSRYPALGILAGTIYGIQNMPNMVKTDPGGRQVQGINLVNGVETLGTAAGIAQTNYKYYPTRYPLNTTDVAAINATESGVKVSA